MGRRFAFHDYADDIDDLRKSGGDKYFAPKDLNNPEKVWQGYRDDAAKYGGSVPKRKTIAKALDHLKKKDN